METGPVSYKSYAGLGQIGSAAAGVSYPPSQCDNRVTTRPSRLDSILSQNHGNVESLVGLIDKLRAVRSRFIGDVPEAGNKNEARALKSGHVGKLEDQAEGMAYGLAQCHEIVADILSL